MAAYSLSEGSEMNITLTVSPGWRWKIGAVAEDKSVDFDLYISDSTGKEVSKDDSPDADAYCTIDAVGDGKYKLLVKSKKGSGKYSLDINPVGPIPASGSTEEKADDTADTTSDDSGLSGGEILKQGLTDEEKTAILDAHNQWRAKYGVGPVEWCETLTRESQKWADELANRGFKMEHSPRPPRTSGENIAYGGNTNLKSRANDLTAAVVVDLWGNEVNDYDYETNTCAPGKVCGHYTQVVWAKTQKVGGGMVKGIVEDANGRKSVQEVWVCNYDPAGNFVGQKPY